MHFFRNSTDYVVVGNPLLDQASNVAQETVRVHDKLKPNTPLAYTINLYNTKSSLWVNGPHYLQFIDNDLPGITELFKHFDNEIKEMNEKIEQSLTKVKENLTLPVGQQDGDWNPSNSKELERKFHLKGPEITPVQEDDGFEKEMELALSLSLQLSKKRVVKCQFCKGSCPKY